MARVVALPDVDETEDVISAQPCILEELHLHHAGSTAVWVHLYDASDVGNVTPGTTVPYKRYRLAAGEDRTFVPSLPFKTGLIIAAFTQFGVGGGASGPGTNEVNGDAIVR